MLPPLISFSPVVDDKARILILGSMPGVASLDAQEYYAHPRNQFWPIMMRLFNACPRIYEEKIAMLLDNRIALWDVVGQCRRSGSLDAKIRDVVPNDIERFLRQYPSIKIVYCNGQTSYKLFGKYVKSVDCDVILLPSTSLAYTIPFERKFECWKMIVQ